VFAAFVVGLALVAGSIWYVGPAGLLQSVERVGFRGFAIYVVYNLLVFLPLGWAWWSVAPGSGTGLARSLVFPWARLVRESAADVLPFSQVGGLFVGVRTVQQHGVSEPLAVASQIADLTAEMASQLVYTLFGIAMLLAILSHATATGRLLWTATLALFLGAATLFAFIALQNRGLDLVGSLASRWLKNTRERADAVKATLQSIYAQPRRLLGGVALHGAAWVLSGAGAWLALNFMGFQIAPWKVLTLESLMATVRSVAFMTPGALGLQEGAYVLVAPLFGLPPEATLSVSLLRRVKDLLIGIPAIGIWQYAEFSGKRRAAVVTPPAV
jgi:putative membrane protein